jgi:hypothetical protein
MKIICTTTFLDGRDRFEVGEVRVVEDAAGTRFIAAGWAREPGADAVAAATGDTTLDVQKAVIGHKEVTRG